MFHPLQFAIVLASIASTVLSSDPDVHTCTRENPYKVIDYWRTYQYAIYGGQIRVNTSYIDVKADFNKQAIYAYVNTTTIDFLSYANETRITDFIGTDSLNWAFLWKHKGHVAVTAHIERNESLGDYEVSAEGCQVTTFTVDEQWVFENASHSRMVLGVPSEWYRVYKEITTVVHKLGLSCLKEHICAAVKNFLEYACSDSVEESPPTMITIRVNVNNAVDKSLNRIRKDIQKRNGTIEIQDVRKIVTFEPIVFNATGGTFTNLSTIERIDDAIAEIRPDQYSIKSTYTLREARIHYDNYSVIFADEKDEGEIFIFLYDLKIQGNSTFNTNNCYLFSQHINLRSIGELKHEIRGLRSVNPQPPNSNERVLRIHKAVIESLLVKALRNAFVYGDSIFGPCMAETPKEDKIYKNDPPIFK